MHDRLIEFPCVLLTDHSVSSIVMAQKSVGPVTSELFGYQPDHNQIVGLVMLNFIG